jgi:hypothetical protein
MTSDPQSEKKPKGSSPERRRVERAKDSGNSNELSWEEKVLKRVGKHVKPIDPASTQEQANDIGWEAASLEVLKHHSQTSDNKKAK